MLITIRTITSRSQSLIAMISSDAPRHFGALTWKGSHVTETKKKERSPKKPDFLTVPKAPNGIR